MSLRRVAELSTAEVRFAEGVVVQPIGATEQHGPHLPLSTDALFAERFAEAAAERAAAECWLLPLLPYGVSTEHADFPGTVSLRTATLAALLADVADSVARGGGRRLVLLNFHGGNTSLIDALARELRAASGLLVVQIMPALAGPPPGVADPDAGGIGHAGHMETSLLLHLEPELVRVKRMAPDGTGVAAHFAASARLAADGPVPLAENSRVNQGNGTLGDPSAASADDGRAWFEHWATAAAEAIDDVARYEPPAPG